ncbi:macrolide 2'-phosphotransferase [Nesterenkonia sp.]|uniref:macrolide 2'-phosphotransferase n=1 Tax=Nesterenkonia sp. TaxID=704201 RepID=UPI00261F14C6|nr:macrolide 2'-phosphotransferase [Nesterenkonia sp.]
MNSSSLDDVLERAAWHGLALNAQTVEINESGLDFTVALADDAAGDRWVLRIPRRPDVVERMHQEARILDLVRPYLSPAVPDWIIQAEELLAYRALPGRPGMNLLGGEPQWHMDPESPQFAEELGRLLAQLHSIDPEEARAAGVEVRTPEQVRQNWQEEIETVAAEFDVAADLLRRWRGWLDADQLWPQSTVMTHGEMYPAHVLLSESGEITGVLDWTTARVDDPGRDFAYQFSIGGQEAFSRTVEAYEQAGGEVWPHLAEHAHEIWAASPVAYGMFALTTEDPQHRIAAAALLNPDATN